MNVSREQYNAYHQVWLKAQPFTFKLNLTGLNMTSLLVATSLVALGLLHIEIDLATWFAAGVIFAANYLFQRAALLRFRRELLGYLALSELIEKVVRYNKPEL